MRIPLISKLSLVLAALTLAFGLVNAQPASADEASDVCNWISPNPSGYVVAATSTEINVVDGKAYKTVKCSWHPVITPNYGPLCGMAWWRFSPTMSEVWTDSPHARYYADGTKNFTCP